MKYLLFVCEGLSDDPLEDLDGRTPLEAAKTPVMDGLAQKGKIGDVSFVPAGLELSPQAACLSLLGYDPAETYTGLAPLEAPAFGVETNDREIIFRADLVTLLDDTLMDATSGGISKREAGILLEEAAAKPENKDIVAKIRKDFGAALADASVRERLGALGNEVMIMTPAEFRKMIVDQIADTAQIFKAAGIKPQ